MRSGKDFLSQLASNKIDLDGRKNTSTETDECLSLSFHPLAMSSTVFTVVFVTIIPKQLLLLLLIQFQSIPLIFKENQAGPEEPESSYI